MTSERLAPDGLAGLLGPEGPVAAAFARRDAGAGAYEHRGQQVAMAARVAEALSSGRHALIEAGTGVGKSFAYLVPALSWAAEHDKRVAVATSTIALQEQLVRRDLPLLAQALPFEVSYALVKGRGNYVCLRRLDRALEARTSLFGDEGARAQLEEIRAWSLGTREGSRQDLPFQPQPAVWEAVQAEQGNCMGRACAHYARCPYQRSRRNAHGARLLVLNHHLLMADLALRRTGAGFLPALDAIVVDEAHDLEDTAAEHLGLRVSSLGVLHHLGRLWSPRRRRGLLGRREHAGLRALADEARRAARAFFEQVREALAPQAPQGPWTVSVPGGAHLPDVLSPRLATLAERLLQAAAGLREPEAALELGARARSLRALADGVAALARDEVEDQVRWAEASTRGALVLHSAPVDVGPLLDEVLWQAHHAVVLTSATLSAGQPPSFAFLRARLGLQEADEASIGSPFDYERQVRLVLRPDLPDPARAPAAWHDALPEAVLAAVRRTRGGAFVLFTSNATMRRTAEALRAPLEAEGLSLLVQGERLERPALLEAFRAGDAVLFGVASFWQGVDVPGPALRHVVLVRLPFEVPTHPLQVARRRRVEERGGDAFRDLSLPLAALRLKQGFGRLVRHTDDRGLVTLLDPRAVTRSYGRVLLAGLPACPREVVEGS